ncbi:MAG: hypothetical protein COY38_00895 [Candidatus Aenigmarchaeota archaeon CG_4_10_14_0_8_um_filter_37_24]|nr:DUF4258 domain-containing protein [Candidatus Aenigmarchaeota archaeon]OIN87232.1 MAG: hypothetical protein AUJ50_02945 [Candidatus Aenigmarchaeota archaeon CG1_02_38_14]PIV69597.1 MAG: hypothetical protein COS07_00185 [Candidatus Aenigmarchaeota archaeon CG01_land_8_20_14_3_00_37_9]PIW40814.1 MAG: hypothetical protein COW21_05205 [Candidatus Aenigmarchaeota archaeon CG15_BIG_FIL_POST_REV_8_21_14_020_37_27]PIX51003.1 MAG: hypothetical protein COZ52_01200 [Candidatus Aenigmarchaeota archaeon 
MKIKYTTHAEERISCRFIKKEWVRKAINNPDKTIDVKNGKKQAIKKINSDKISVIYAEENNEIVVVTVYWGE